MSAALGYPTLNRYDPRVAVPDAAVYAQMAEQGASHATSHLRFRILVPFLARQVFAVARNHTGSWNPMMFSFLAVNAFFVATSAFLLFRMGLSIFGQASVALLASCLYLLNFSIANLHLAALVDAAEACLLLAIVASMFYRRWVLLPLWAVFGTLAKESFVLFSLAMALAWWLASPAGRNRRAAMLMGIMALSQVATMIIVQASVTGHAVSPWSFAASMNSPTNYLTNLWNSLVDRNSWYILIWLLPLGLAGRAQMPREWKAAATAAVGVAILLNAYHSTVGGGGGGLGRYVFNVAGPLLSLSAAAFLANWYGEQSTRQEA